MENGTSDSLRLIYFNYDGSAGSTLHYHTMLLGHNTIFKPEDSFVKSAMTIDMDNPDISDFLVRNNIIGEYHSGDWDLLNQGKGDSDYNLFYPAQSGGGVLGAHSLMAAPQFVDNGDYHLSANSPAIGLAGAGGGAHML